MGIARPLEPKCQRGIPPTPIYSILADQLFLIGGGEADHTCHISTHPHLIFRPSYGPKSNICTYSSGGAGGERGEEIASGGKERKKMRKMMMMLISKTKEDFWLSSKSASCVYFFQPRVRSFACATLI